MRKVKLNSLFVIGLVLFSIAHIATHIVGTPNDLLHALSGFASGLILAGTLTYFISPRIKQWKMGLVGKTQE